MSSLSLLVPPGSLLPCFCQSSCCHWDCGIFPCVQDPLSHRLREGHKGCVWNRGRSCRCLYNVIRFTRFCHCGWRTWRWGGGCFSRWCMASQAPLPLLPSYPSPRGPLWSGAGVVCTASSAAGVSEAAGLAAAVSRPGLLVLTLLFPRFHLSPPAVQRCGILQHTLVSGRGIFVEPWMLYWL